MKYIKNFLVLSLGLGILGCSETESRTQILEVWVWDEPQVIEALALEFALTEKNKYEIQVRDFQTESDLRDEFYKSSVKGFGPDVIMTTGGFLTSNRDLFEPLDLKEVWSGAAWGEAFVPAAHNYTTYGEDIYGVPLWMESLGLIYNFQKYESRVPYSNEPASNWVLLLRDLQFLTQKDNNDQLIEGGIALGGWQNIAHAREILGTLFWQNQVYFFDTNGTSMPIMENPAMLQTAEKIVEFYESFGVPTNENYTWSYDMAPYENGNLKAFVEGRLSIFVGTIGDYLALKKRVGVPGEVPSEFVRVAYFPDSIEGNNLWVESVVLAQPKNSSALASEFLFWLTSQENQESIAFTTQRPSGFASVLGVQALEAADPVFYIQAEKGQAWISEGISVEKQLIFFEDILKLSGSYQQRMAQMIAWMRE